MSQEANPSLYVGKEITLNDKSQGIIRYIGKVQGRTGPKKGIWYGIELKTPTGKNNGTVNGHKYFECKKKYGIFL